MTNEIQNSLKSPDLHVVALTDPSRIRFYVTNLANQINDSRASSPNPKRCVDLSEHIADIIIETTAQGASMLEVHVIDPAWTLLQRDSNGVSFLDVDEQGYLWPPIEVNFPPDVSDATWRLCQCRPSTSLDQPNLILTFEDKIVAELREHSGPEQSHPNETRAEFIRRLVKQASQHKLIPGDVGIRFIPLLPTSVFTAADLAGDQVSLPASAKQPNPPPARRDHTKGANVGASVQPTVYEVKFGALNTVNIVIDALNGGIGNSASPAANVNSSDWIPNFSYVPGVDTNGR